MSLKTTLDCLLQIAALLVALHGPLNVEPEPPTRTVLPLMVCPR